MKLRIYIMLLFLWGITFISYSQKATIKLEKAISIPSINEHKTLTGIILDEKEEPIIGA